VKNDTSLSASIKAQLKNEARGSNRPFNDLLQLYGIERFLYRLSLSPYAEKFILKGALMLLTFDIPSFRPTRDIDLLGYTSNRITHISKIFREISRIKAEADGMIFDENALKVHRIKENADHAGVRVTLKGYLGKALIPVQLDIGFSDQITPAPVMVDYPTLLSLPAPQISGYPLETIVAEKLQAILFLGRINSRMKDFYDIWILISNFDFDAKILQEAIFRTFKHRNTEIPKDMPFALSDSFAQEKQSQWNAFLKRNRLDTSVPELSFVVEALRRFFAYCFQEILKKK